MSSVLNRLPNDTDEGAWDGAAGCPQAFFCGANRGAPISLPGTTGFGGSVPRAGKKLSLLRSGAALDFSLDGPIRAWKERNN